MEVVKGLLDKIVKTIVDDQDKVTITFEETEKGNLFTIKVGKGDVGKVIGKQGRIASAIRTLAKAAGSKQGIKVMVNVFKDPVE